MNTSQMIFYALSLFILAASIGVVVVQNPVYSALCLVFTLLGVAGIFALLGAHFLAVAQIVVYAGAIVVLFVFVLMLLNVKREEYQPRVLTLSIFATAAAVPFVMLVFPVLSAGFTNPAPEVPGTVTAIGELLFGKYVAAFEASSVLLIAALVGAVMLGKRSIGRSGR